ncbi:right-handed parallel beta-helix repeat-containing protein, partial [Hamadaea sp. NPDC051192]|uniref:right-handed parallel beta-helix repeat-containing protein n=1 Tax=Hamadaea sp. NPDC051192 TaxID=3154940 RepID=UPI0034261B5C
AEGTGARPVVAGQGAVYAAVHLYNVEYWEIHDLEVTNDSATAAERNGLLVELENFGVGHHYLIDDVYVHHVAGDQAAAKRSNGIQLRVTGTAVPTRFSDAVVRNSEVYHVDREGLTTASEQNCRTIYGCTGTQNWLASTGVVFQNNVVHDTGGDGIVMRVADHAVVEGNEVYDIALRNTGNNAGLWTINSDYTLIQHNEVYRVNRYAGTNDGMAFDSDYGNRGVVFQYNFSHDNEGGFMLFCGACGGSANTSGTIVRHNISINDGSRLLYAVGEQAAQVYNNTFYLPSGSATAVIEDTTGTTTVRWQNNVFYNLGSGAYAGSGYVAADHTWRANVFYGSHPASEPVDAYKSTANPLLANPGGSAPADYQLTAGSPALRSGQVTTGAGGQDYFGDPAPLACRPDAGAHQRSAFTDSACLGTTMTANGGFETGSLSGWPVATSGRTWADSSSVRSGVYAGKLGPYAASLEQTVTVAPNTTYVLSGWGRVDKADTQLVVGVKNYGGMEVRVPAYATGEWRAGSVTFTTGASATSVVVFCYARSGTGYGWCDDVRLIPQPS